MLKNIEEKKRLIAERKFYLEEMKKLAELYDNLDEAEKDIIENILKTQGRISLLIKKEIDSLSTG